MAIPETFKKLVKKILTLGTPPKEEVLYEEVIKRKAPEKSAEALVFEDMKNSIKKIWTPKENIESSATPVEEDTIEKKSIKKTSTAKKSPVKKPVAKKTATKTTTPKNTTKTTTEKKTTTKKPATKNTATTKNASTTKTTKSSSTTTTTKKTTAKKVTKTATTKKPATQKETQTKANTKKTTKSSSTTTTKEPTTTTKKTTAKKVTKTATAKKSATQKETQTKANTKKSTTKTAPAKKISTSKKTTAAKGNKRDEKIALYIKDIKKHYGEVDEAFVAVIVKNLGPSIYRKDAELVSCSDPKELDTVRRNFLIKKLGIEASKAVLDAAIEDVCQELKGVRTKYRATFYYALAKKFKKESVLH
jgi:DNA polymerase III gamma/tau subunit